MKNLNLLFTASLLAIISNFCTADYGTAPKEKSYLQNSFSNYDEYVFINEELWKFTYSDDGKLISQTRVFD